MDHKNLINDAWLSLIERIQLEMAFVRLKTRMEFEIVVFKLVHHLYHSDHTTARNRFASVLVLCGILLRSAFTRLRVESRGAQNIQNGCRLFMFINTPRRWMAAAIGPREEKGSGRLCASIRTCFFFPLPFMFSQKPISILVSTLAAGALEISSLPFCSKF